MNYDCVVTSVTQGRSRILRERHDPCTRDFTCQSVTSMAYYNVTCPGTKQIITWQRVDTWNWRCTMYSDGCVYTYTYSENVTETWDSVYPCSMPGGRACCLPGDMLIGEGHNVNPTPDPLPPNPFR